MLTLVKDSSATQIVEIHKRSTRSKKAYANVYYTHNAVEQGNVAPAKGVLALHKDMIKKVHKLSNADFERITVMLDTGEEPDVGEPLRTEYWEVKKVFERALRNEMYLGDQNDLYFEHNLTRDKKNWSGNFLVVGNSGAGKTFWVVSMLMRYLRATKPYARRSIIWASPEYTIDKSLKPLKDRRFAFSVIGIDISEQALQKSGMDAVSYYKAKVSDVLERNSTSSLIVLDDFMDSAPALTSMLRKEYIRGLRTARHKVTSVISLVHSYASGKNTSQALQSVTFVLFFPRSSASRVVMFLRDHCHIPIQEGKEIVARFAKLDRWMIVRMHSPVAIYNSKYLMLI